MGLRSGRQRIGKYIIIDEFQEVADLSGRKLSDTAFLAMAREFRCREIIATQSYSGLAAVGGQAGLEALTANLNSKIFFHTEDPLTRQAAEAMGGRDLIYLQKNASRPLMTPGTGSTFMGRKLSTELMD